MSTYIPGAIQYIPQVQPFQPNLNFYQQVLETKNAQYKEGYNKLSSLYGNLLESPMLRTENLELRNKFFNDIGKEITKISGLDLSLSQNVDAAYKVFQPLIDNQYILKDMAYTKRSYAEMRKAESFKNCTDEKKCGGKYWEGGVRALQYKMQEFADSSAEDSLKMSPPSYTPYVNVTQKAMEWAKQMGFSVTSAPTRSGGYLITTKNGAQMIPDLTEAFLSVFGNDPQITELYNTQAYLRRKDFVYGNIDQFGGSAEAAEQYYIDSMSKFVSAKTQKEREKAANLFDQATLKSNILEERIKKQGVDPNDPNDQRIIEGYNQSLSDQLVAAAAKDYYTEANEISNPIIISQLDVIAKRSRIDNAVAGNLLLGDLSGAARNYSMLTMDTEVDVDQYALADYKHRLDKDLELFKNALEIEKEEAKKKEKEALTKQLQQLIPSITPGGSTPANPNYFDDEYTNAKNVRIQEAGAQAEVVKELAAYLDNIINAEPGANGKNPVVFFKDQQAYVEVTPQMREYAKQQKAEIFKQASTWQEKKPYESQGGSWLNVAAGPLALAYNWAFGEDEQATYVEKSKAGLLDANGKLVDFQSSTDYTGNPKSDVYHRKVYDRVMNFINNDVVLNTSGLLGKSASFRQKVANANYAKATTLAVDKELANYTKTVHDAVLNSNTFNDFGDVSPSVAKNVLADWVKPDGGIMTEDEFVARFLQAKPESYFSSGSNPMVGIEVDYSHAEEDARELYRNYGEYFKKAFAGDKDAPIKIPGGARSANGSKALTRPNIDTADPTSIGAQNFFDVYKDFKTSRLDPNSKVIAVMGDVGKSTQKNFDDYLEGNNEQAAQLLDVLFNNFVAGTKDTDASRAIFDMTTHNVVGNQDEYVGFTFTLNPNFVNDNKGSGDKPGLTAGMDSNQFSVLIPRKELSAKNSAMAPLSRTPEDIMMKAYGKIDINAFEEFGGMSSVVPNADGSYSVYNRYKTFDENGNLVDLIDPEPILLPADVNLQEAVSIQQNALMEIYSYNKPLYDQMYQNRQKVKDPNQVKR